MPAAIGTLIVAAQIDLVGGRAVPGRPRRGGDDGLAAGAVRQSAPAAITAGHRRIQSLLRSVSTVFGRTVSHVIGYARANRPTARPARTPASGGDASPGVHVLETIGGAVLEWIVGEGMGKGRELLGREPEVRDLDTVIRTAVEPAVRVVTTDDATRQSLRAALDEKLAARLDLSPGELADPATCVRRWLAPLGETGLGGLTYWQHTSVDGDLVADALAAEVVRG